MNKLRLPFLLALLALFGLARAGSFDFPQNKDYPFGIRVTDANASSTIQSLYEKWKKAFYVEGTRNGTAMARIKFTDAAHGSPNGEHTVSEGIGYGMFIFVYMNNATNLTQTNFDKLWLYYKSFENSKGVMEWKTNGFSNVQEAGGATDGDLDVAFSLLLADKQWGSSGSINYVKEAQTLLTAIMGCEIGKRSDNLNLITSGSNWTGDEKAYNPCYYTMAGVHMFDVAQTQLGFNSGDWKSVLSRGWTYLSASQNKTSGFYPDWSNPTGGPTTNTNAWKYEYGMDACRTPWRVAQEFSWYGSTESKSQASITASWVSTKITDPGSVGDWYTMDGTKTKSWNNAAYVGGFASALMIDQKYSTLLKTYYSKLVSFDHINQSDGANYYCSTLQLLYALYLTGNMPNFYDKSGPVAGRITDAATASTTTIKVSFSKALSAASASDAASFTVKVGGVAKTVSGLVLSTDKKSVTLTIGTTLTSDDVIALAYSGTLKDADNLAITAVTNLEVVNSIPANGFMLAHCDKGQGPATALGGEWYTYTDKANGGKSTIKPVTTEKVKFAMTLGGANGSDSSAVVKYSFTQAAWKYEPFVGVGFKIKKDSSVTGAEWSNSTGVEFYHKGGACTLSIFMLNYADPAKKTSFPNGTAYQWYSDIQYSHAIAASTDWQLVKLTWASKTDFPALPAWAPLPVPAGIDPTQIFKIQFQASGALLDVNTPEATFAIDQVKITGLTPPVIINKTALADKIASADKTLAAAVIGTSNGQYPQTAATTFNAAIVAAKKVNDLATATQAEVDAAESALNSAIRIFESSKITLDLTKLEAAITAAEAFKKTAVEGDGNGEYSATVLGALTAEITTATTLKGSATATQAELDAEAVKLTELIATTKEAVNVVSYTELESAISKAETDYTTVSANVGVCDGQYTQAATKALSDAIAAAKLEKAKTDLSVAEVAAAAGAVSNAATAALASKQAIKHTDLGTTIAEIKTIVADNASNIGTGNGQYSEETYTALKAKLDAAQLLDADKCATAVQMLSMIDGLNAAKQTFLDSKVSVTVNYKALTDKITEAKALKFDMEANTGACDGNYTPNAAASLTTAISAAETAKAGGLTQEQVATETEKLAAAMATAKTAIVKIDKSALAAKLADTKIVLDTTEAKIGLGNGSYPQAKWDALYADSVKAALAYTDKCTTTAEAGTQITNLTASIKALLDSRIKVDYTALKDALAAAETVAGAAVVGTAVGEYTQAAKDNYTAVIAAAKLVLADKKATQDAVAAEAKKVADATATFKTQANSIEPATAEEIAALKAAVAEATTLAGKVGTLPGQYPSATAINAAIAKATAIADKAGATKSEVNSELAAITKAISDYKLTAIPENDKAALTAQITVSTTAYTAAKVGTLPGEYPAAAAEEFQKAIDAAKATKALFTATAAEIKTAADALKTAQAAFEATKIGAADNAALLVKISDAKKALATTTEGTTNGTYPAAERTKLQAAIDAADVVAKNTAATSTEISTAVSTLTDAITAYNKTIINIVDKAALSTTLAAANDLIATTVAGTQAGQYSVALNTQLKTAAAAADALVKSTTATQEEVDAQKSALAKLIDEYKKSKVLDQASLNNAIVAAESLIETTQAGTTDGTYSADALADLKLKLADAVAVKGNAAASQAVISAATAALEASIAAYKETKVVVDRTLLSGPLAEAQQLISTTTAGTTDGSYGTEARAALEAKNTAALNIKETAAITTAQVTSAVADLNAAIAAYKLTKVTVDRAALNKQLTASEMLFNATQEGTTGGKYPTEARTAFKAAITAAKTTANKIAVTQKDVDDAAAALAAAQSAYEAARSIDRSELEMSIAMAEASLEGNAANIGDYNGAYPETAYKALTAALATAETALTAAKTEAEVTAAAETLDTALETFSESKIVITTETEELKTLITGVKELLKLTSYTPESTVVYPAEARRALQAAQKEAVLILNSPKATAEDLKTAAAALTAAVEEYNKSEMPVTAIEDEQAANIAVSFNSSSISVSSSEVIKMVIVYGLQGSKVISVRPNAASTVISTRALSQAAYKVRVMTDNGMKTVTIVK